MRDERRGKEIEGREARRRKRRDWRKTKQYIFNFDGKDIEGKMDDFKQSSELLD